jgi:hypothetical protein
MRQVFGGAVLVILGIAAFIEAHAHRPMTVTGEERAFAKAYGQPVPKSGLSQTA